MQDSFGIGFLFQILIILYAYAKKEEPMHQKWEKNRKAT